MAKEFALVWFTNESIAIGTPARQEHRFIELAAETEEHFLCPRRS